jgi:hypothetical protein
MPSAAVIRSSHYFPSLVHLLIDHGSIASELLTLQSKGKVIYCAVTCAVTMWVGHAGQAGPGAPEKGGQRAKE